MYIREACIEHLSEALEAERKGADRIEFCSQLEWDGLSPNLEDVAKALSLLHIPISVMIRPRKGDFEYTQAEFITMKEEIIQCQKLGVHCVVFGITKATSADLVRTRILAELAEPMEVCFHKAIDLVEDLVQTTEELANIPQITRILTSGGMPTAEEGIPVLHKMMTVAEGRLSIMPAGKITPKNIDAIHLQLGAKEYHGRNIL